MDSIRRRQSGFKGILVLIILIIFSILMVTCKNPLLTEMEEVVDVVVTPASVVSVYPENGAVDIPINVEIISISFTKAILPSLRLQGTTAPALRQTAAAL